MASIFHKCTFHKTAVSTFLVCHQCCINTSYCIIRCTIIFYKYEYILSLQSERVAGEYPGGYTSEGVAGEEPGGYTSEGDIPVRG